MVVYCSINSNINRNFYILNFILMKTVIKLLKKELKTVKLYYASEVDYWRDDPNDNFGKRSIRTHKKEIKELEQAIKILTEYEDTKANT